MLLDPEQMSESLLQLPGSVVLRNNVDQKLQMYRLLHEQEVDNRKVLVVLARREDVVRRFTVIPGVGWVRAVTFFV